MTPGMIPTHQAVRGRSVNMSILFPHDLWPTFISQISVSAGQRPRRAVQDGKEGLVNIQIVKEKPKSIVTNLGNALIHI